MSARLLVGLVMLLLLVGGGAQIPIDSPIGDDMAQVDVDVALTAPAVAPEPAPPPVRADTPPPAMGTGRVHLDSVFRPPRPLAAG